MRFIASRLGLQVLWSAAATIICIYIIFNSSFSSLINLISRRQYIHTSKHELLENGYVTSSYAQNMPGKLGNNFFGLLALIGIADKLKRNPYVRLENEKIHPKIWTLKQQFPRLYDQLDFDTSNVSEAIVPFANGGCCHYDNPEKLRDYVGTYLHLQGSYFQSYLYFDHLRDKVREWLKPSERIQRRATTNLPKAYRNRFLICVHTQRDDYVTDNYHAPSDPEFSVNALRYLFLKYDRPHIGALILGSDRIWNKQTFHGIPNVYVTENSNKEQDMALAQNYCDIVLLTAPSSPFGFFIGYTSKTSTVYYRDITSTQDRVKFEMKQEEFYPRNWTKLGEQSGLIMEM